MLIKFSELYNHAKTIAIPKSQESSMFKVKHSYGVSYLVRKHYKSIIFGGVISKAKVAILMDAVCKTVNPNDHFFYTLKSNKYQAIRNIISIGIKNLKYIDDIEHDTDSLKALTVGLLVEEIAMILNVFDIPFYEVEINF